MKKIISIILASLLISACSSYYSSKGDQNYVQSRNGPELNIRPPLTDTNLSGFYKLPPQNQNPKVSIKPPKH